MKPIFSDEAAGTAKYNTIRLGSFDEGSKPANLKTFFKRYHNDILHKGKASTHFRDEATNDWNPLVSTGKPDYVKQWQAFLKRAGFLPFQQEEGIFGYVTLAASRLFQEYIRTVEGIAGIGVPDGIVGPNTRRHANRWDENGFKCSWWPDAQQGPSKEYQMWMDILKQSKEKYLRNPHPILKLVQESNNTGDSVKLSDWNWDPSNVHLLGIRRNPDKRATHRGNDDLFVLLLQGMVFKFYGSTDPKPVAADRHDEAYLVEGQHKYRMSWHNIGQFSKVYKALKPYASKGVLVFRDSNKNDALDEADIAAGLKVPNNTINIHWSGVGSSNWSAGCQVIAGASYLNPDGQLVDCRAFAAQGYDALSQRGQTRGAYNVLCDLVLAYSPLNQNEVWYTLGRDAVLDVHPDLGADWAKMMVENMKIKG